MIPLRPNPFCWSLAVGGMAGSFFLGSHFDSGVLDMSQRIVLGVLIILFLIAEPDGLVALWDRVNKSVLSRA